MSIVQQAGESCQQATSGGKWTVFRHDKWVVPFYSNSLTQKIVRYMGPHIWNFLPNDLKLVKNKTTFYKKLKSYFASSS